MNRVPRLAPVVFLSLVAGVAGFALTADAIAQPQPSQPSSTPPGKRPLSGEAAARVAKLEQQIAQLQREGQFANAVEPAREVAEIRARLQGDDHWQTADARRTVHDLRTFAALPGEGRKALASLEE